MVANDIFNSILCSSGYIFATCAIKRENENLPTSCAEANAFNKCSGVYEILLEAYSSQPFLVECEAQTLGGGWTIVQRRQDGSVDFFRSWAEYKRGFGQTGGEFFIGLDKLHALTSHYGPHELLIILEIDNEIVHAKYDDFAIGNESEWYNLKKLGKYSGTAGDALSPNLGRPFTTKDHYFSYYMYSNMYEGNYASLFEGAWWFNDLHRSHLNGKYGDMSFGKGIVWHAYRGYDVSIQKVTIMTRQQLNICWKTNETRICLIN